jgi:hypothetical protein
MPDFIDISNPRDNNVPDVITVQLSVEGKSKRDFCELMVGSAASTAEAINGVVGGIGGVASLFCKAYKG